MSIRFSNSHLTNSLSPPFKNIDHVSQRVYSQQTNKTFYQQKGLSRLDFKQNVLFGVFVVAKENL
jgi:hypothetical protein